MQETLCAAVVKTLIMNRMQILELQDDEWQWHDRLIRSLIHLERLDAALQHAEKWTDATGDPWYLALVFAAQRDAGKTLLYLERCLEIGYPIESFYQDDILAPAIRSPGFEKIRQRFSEPGTSEPIYGPAVTAAAVSPACRITESPHCASWHEKE